MYLNKRQVTIEIPEIIFRKEDIKNLEILNTYLIPAFKIDSIIAYFERQTIATIKDFNFMTGLLEKITHCHIKDESDDFKLFLKNLHEYLELSIEMCKQVNFNNGCYICT